MMSGTRIDGWQKQRGRAFNSCVRPEGGTA